MRLLEKDVRAGVYGLAVGDALGVPFEFLERAEVKKYDLSIMYQYGTHNQPAGTWSDDTSMVLATLDALGGNVLSMNRVMGNFCEWLEQGSYTANGNVFDFGGTTSRSIHRYLMGELPVLCGEDDEYSNGNGSLMRMLPVAYYLWLNSGLFIDESTVKIIEMFSSLTHAHAISKECCVYYVYVALYIMAEGAEIGLKRAIEKGIDAVEAYYRDNGGSSVLGVRGVASLKEIFSLEEENIRSTGYVVDSLEASLWCLYHSSNYPQAVSEAVSLGSDTDTIGAITGSLAGLYYGMESIPNSWVAVLQNKRLIDAICTRFFEQYK